MLIYSETGDIIENPDLELGVIKIVKTDVVIAHHPAIPLKTHIEERDGKKIRVIDQQPKEAWDEYEIYGVYHPYTPEELKTMNKPTDSERITALEAFLEALIGGIESVQ